MHASERWDTPEQEAVKAAHLVVLEKQNKLMYALEGRRTDITEGNRGDADKWIRHIDKAYLDYSDACDEWKEAKEALKSSKLSLIERLKRWK